MQEGPDPQAQDVTLRDYLDLLRRRKAIIVQTFVVVFVVGAVVTFLTKPIYRSTTRILVEGKSLKLAQYNANDPLSGLFTDNAGHDVATQLEVIQSDAVMKNAFETLSIPRESVDVKVRQVDDTDVIEIAADSTSANRAERVAKELPRTYLKAIKGDRKEEVDNALEFARNRLTDEGANLRRAEKALQDYRRGKRIGSLEVERNKRTAQATAADSEVMQAESALAGAQARLDALVTARRSLKPVLETPTTVTNPQIEQTRNSIALLQTDRSKLLILYKPTHAEVAKVDAQIAALEGRLRSMPRTVTSVTRTPNPQLSAYEDKVNEARAAVSSASMQVAEARQRMARSDTDLSQYSAMELDQAQIEREVERHRETVGLLTKSVEDLSLRRNATHDPLQVIQPATVAEKVSPRQPTNLVLSAVVGLLLGICFALLQEFLDDRVNAPEDARRIMGAPTIGYIPLVPEEEGRILTGPRGGALLESYRVLRSAVQFASVDTPASSLVVTSTAPGEGKSTTAANLAIAMALDGKRVILVDADLRRPTLHQKFGLSQKPGLTNVLIGQASLEDALQETNIEGLRIVTSGAIPPNPAELLNSRAMRGLNDQLKEHADVVVFDTPPCLATADAQVLSAEVDGVLYVVQLGETRKSAVRHAIEMLEQARARLIGVVFNKIDTGSRRDDYYGYYSYYNAYTTSQLPNGETHRRRSSSGRDALLPKNGSSSPTDTAVVAGRAEEEEEA
ncbi:MAG: polysaccharide biosynthesis tyrosine autokinase [Chthonomonadales bacterium]|nr:polysaccharide biosynthesis tyrosine autokinase [Chthonomonadales bacterium]